MEHGTEGAAALGIGKFAIAAFAGVMLVNLPQARAASDAGNSGAVSVQATTAVASPIAAGQTVSIISGAVSGGFMGSGGGFAPSSGSGGGFSPSGSGGSGGGFSPSGSGGSGGGFSPGAGGGSGGSGGGEAKPGNGASLEKGPSIGAAETYDPLVSADKSTNIPFVSTRNGRAAGNGASDTGIWAQATAARINKSEDALKMHGNVYNAVFGLDHRFTPDVLAGLALSYERTGITTAYNNGTFEGSGLAVAPYVGFELSPAWSVSFTLGYAWLNYDVERNDGAIKGSYDATRWFGAANLTGGFASGNWRYQPNIGVQWSRERQGSYTETGNLNVVANTTSVGRTSAGSKIGYALDNGVPYVKLMGEWDFLTPESILKSSGQMSDTSRYGGVVGLGYEHYVGGFTGSAELNYNSLLRDDLDLWTAALRIRWDF